MTAPLNLNKPIGQKSVSQATSSRDWKPRISLTLVNPVVSPAPVSEPQTTAKKEASVELQAKEDTQAEAPAPRFQPWEQEAMTDGFLRLENGRMVGASPARLLLTPELRVPGPGEPANFNTPAPHSKRRFTLKPALTERSGNENAVSDQPTSHGASKPGEPGSAAPTSNARELDEGMLRDVVADVVREELRGALGERITRNVRKLVRSEINRAVEATRLTELDGDTTR